MKYALILNTIVKPGCQIRYMPSNIDEGHIINDNFVGKNDTYMSITNCDVVKKLEKKSYIFTFDIEQLVERYGKLNELKLLRIYFDEISHYSFINFRGRLCLEFYYNNVAFYFPIDFDDPFCFNNINRINRNNSNDENKRKNLIYFPKKVG